MGNQLAQMQEEISRIERERLEMEELRRSADDQLEELKEYQERQQEILKEEEAKREAEIIALRDQIQRDRDEETRLTEAQRNKELHSQLEELKNQLGDLKDTNATTVMDQIHAENVKQGRDKYKTLKQIRRGNTKSRVDQFEAL